MDSSTCNCLRVNQVTRILIITNSFKPYVGGIETFTESLAKGLLEKGYSVSVAVKLDIPIISGLPTPIAPEVFPIHFAANMLEVWKMSRRCEIVIFSQFSLHYFPIVFLSRAKYFIVHHTSDLIYSKSLTFIERIKRTICKNLDNVFVSKSLMEIVNLPGKVIHNGTVWPWIGPQHQTSRAIDVLYVGRLVQGKGVETLVHAMSYLKSVHPNLEIKTMVIGEGNLGARLERLTRKYQLEDVVTFVGVQDAETVRESMLASKTVIVPSEFHEPFGLVAIEALMAGCIPIVSNLGGILEACHGRAITFEPGNVKQLSEVIHRTLVSLPEIEQGIFQNLEPSSFNINRMILDYENHITNRLHTL